jgi:hypothetical protein
VFEYQGITSIPHYIGFHLLFHRLANRLSSIHMKKIQFSVSGQKRQPHWRLQAMAALQNKGKTCRPNCRRVSGASQHTRRANNPKGHLPRLAFATRPMTPLQRCLHIGTQTRMNTSQIAHTAKRMPTDIMFILCSSISRFNFYYIKWQRQKDIYKTL